MGRTPTPEQEIEALKAIIREAHETMRDLRVTIRDARQLIARLLIDVQATADSEVRQLANWMQVEANRHAANLNADVDRAKDEIVRQLTTTKLILDPVGDRFEVQFHPGHFDDRRPLPHPDHPVKDVTA